MQRIDFTNCPIDISKAYGGANGSKIDLDSIYNIIDNTPYISDIHKEFAKAYITQRKEKILDYSIQNNLNLETCQNNEISM